MSRVVMLVVSDGHDIRALKEADVLRAAGYDVTLVGRASDGEYNTRVLKNGVRIVVVPTIDDYSTAVAVLRRNWSFLRYYDRIRLTFLTMLFFVGGLDLGPNHKVEAPANGSIAKWNSWTFRWNFRVNRFLKRIARKLPDSAPKRIILSTYRALSTAYYRFVFPVLVFFPLVIMGIYRSISRKLRSKYNWIRAKLRQIVRHLYVKQRYFLYYAETIRSVSECKPDIVHAHDLYMLQAAVRSSRALGASCIYDAHEYEAHRLANSAPWLEKRIRDEESEFAPHAHGVITISHSVAARMAQEVGIATPQVVFNAPIVYQEPPSDADQTSDIRSELGLGQETPLAVFVGKIYDIFRHDHRIDNVIQAMTVLPEMHLAFLGQRSPAGESQIVDWSRRHRVEDRVHLVDPVPYWKLVRYISSADLALNPMENRCLNVYFSMPNKLFEYVFAGLPVCQSDLFDSTNFLNELNAGLPMNSRCVRSIASTMDDVYRRRSELTLTGDKLSQVRDEYDWAAQGAKLLNLYGDVLKSRDQASYSAQDVRELLVDVGRG